MVMGRTGSKLTARNPWWLTRICKAAGLDGAILEAITESAIRQS
jgi:hypothetical protein